MTWRWPIAYELRSNRRELDKAILEVLPSARAFIGANADASTLLLNSTWVPLGATVSANLMNVFKLPARRQRIQAQEALLDRRAMALAVAIVTQVHVSRARFGHAKQRFRTSQQRVGVQVKIRTQIRSAVEAGTASDQTLIREEMNTLVARAKRDIAYSEMQNTFANIYASIGIAPFAAGIDRNESVDQISDALQAFWRDQGDFGTAAAKARPAVAQADTTAAQPKAAPQRSAPSSATQPRVVNAPAPRAPRISQTRTAPATVGSVVRAPLPRSRPAPAQRSTRRTPVAQGRTQPVYQPQQLSPGLSTYPSPASPGLQVTR